MICEPFVSPNESTIPPGSIVTVSPDATDTTHRPLTRLAATSEPTPLCTTWTVTLEIVPLEAHGRNEQVRHRRGLPSSEM